MKKLVKVVSIVAALALTVGMLTGCHVSASSSSEDSLTRNGVTRTETTVTENGKTTTTVTYTDANGHQLSADEGEAAMNGTAAVSNAATAAIIVTGEAAAQGENESAEAETITATLSFDNQSGRTIKGLYVVVEGRDDWGENLLEADGELPNETKRTWEDCVTYTADRTWKMAIQFADAEDGALVTFSGIRLENTSDPHMLGFAVMPKADGTGYDLGQA